MAPRAASSRKVLSEANLARLGAERLAALLMETAGPALKRRLRLELAAEIGPADLALEIDKRLAAYEGSRTRVSWRKRPELLSELQSLKRVVVERLGSMDPRLALDRLVAWFDLYPFLSARVQDPKGELALVFDAATAELADFASRVGPEVAGPVLSEALSTRFNHWASWVGRGAGALSPELARRLLQDLNTTGQRPTGRRALVIRKLADQAGDLNAWVAAIADDDRVRPEMGSELARRLALAGRAAEARSALEAVRPRPAPSARGGRGRGDERPVAPEAWLRAEILVLEAEGQSSEAQAARWRLFERTLSADVLREVLADLPDFEDVEALDRAFETAASYVDVRKGLVFLMSWPALREAAAMIRTRSEDLRGGFEEAPLWAARLAARHPDAALLLLRAHAMALVRLGSGLSEEVWNLVSEAEGLEPAAEGSGIAPHAVFVQELRAATAGSSWRKI